MQKLLLSFFISCSLFSFSQNPLVKIWDKRYGGTDIDYLYSMQQTADGGYMMGGYSKSAVGGNKSSPLQGNFDYWVVKIDSAGNLQWDKDFGGTLFDVFTCLALTDDGGCILGGYSNSGIGGSKTQATWGNDDYWIVKIDSAGNKQWDKDFGGTSYDYLYSLQQTSDGGYILGGFSRSGISGNKTQANWDATGTTGDYWIIKTDSVGNKQWDKTFGGDKNDLLRSLQQTSDGGFILGGYSYSDVSGNKTQSNWDASGSSGDYWIIKTDAFGNQQWQKDFGGTSYDYFYSLQQTTDGGYILAGNSESGIGGDKTQPVWGLSDYWMIKTDSLGNKQWDKDYGGFDKEEFFQVVQTSDRGYLLSGDSYSQIGGDKTENNLGIEQTWLVKTDSLGATQWDKTVFTSGHDETGLAIQTSDGCYAASNFTMAGLGGYKTELNWDVTNATSDYWLVKFCDSTQSALPSSAFAAASPICPGTCTPFLNLSTNAVSYQWIFPGANPSSSTDANPQSICYNTPGTYDVTLIATNANGSDTLTLASFITVYPYPPPQGISQSGDTLFANAGASSYQWYFNGNIISGATNYFYVAQGSGDFNVIATDANGCEVEAVIFNVVASAQFEVSSLMFKIYPNPVEDKLGVRSSEFGVKTVSIEIFGMIGAAVRLLTPNSELPTELDVCALPSGMYWLEVISGDKIFRSKFVKQ